jgi:hypothetical protein
MGLAQVAQRFAAQAESPRILQAHGAGRVGAPAESRRPAKNPSRPNLRHGQRFAIVGLETDGDPPLEQDVQPIGRISLTEEHRAGRVQACFPKPHQRLGIGGSHPFKERQVFQGRVFHVHRPAGFRVISD